MCPLYFIPASFQLSLFIGNVEMPKTSPFLALSTALLKELNEYKPLSAETFPASMLKLLPIPFMFFNDFGISIFNKSDPSSNKSLSIKYIGSTI